MCLPKLWAFRCMIVNVCWNLGISDGSIVRNTCLPLQHLRCSVGVDLIVASEWVTPLFRCIKPHLPSSLPWDFDPNIPAILAFLASTNRVYFWSIFNAESNTFLISDKYGGDLDKPTIYIVDSTSSLSGDIFRLKIVHLSCSRWISKQGTCSYFLYYHHYFIFPRMLYFIHL